MKSSMDSGARGSRKKTRTKRGKQSDAVGAKNDTMESSLNGRKTRWWVEKIEIRKIRLFHTNQRRISHPAKIKIWV